MDDHAIDRGGKGSSAVGTQLSASSGAQAKDINGEPPSVPCHGTSGHDRGRVYTSWPNVTNGFSSGYTLGICQRQTLWPPQPSPRTSGTTHLYLRRTTWLSYRRKAVTTQPTASHLLTSLRASGLPIFFLQGLAFPMVQGIASVRGWHFVFTPQII